MNVTRMTDVQQLKALAYDQMVLQEQIQRNLALITARINELQVQIASSQPQNDQE